jgi:hypothetical protein
MLQSVWRSRLVLCKKPCCQSATKLRFFMFIVCVVGVYIEMQSWLGDLVYLHPLRLSYEFFVTFCSSHTWTCMSRCSGRNWSSIWNVWLYWCAVQEWSLGWLKLVLLAW